MKWTPDDVCDLINKNTISANDLIQSNKLNTKKLVKEFYLLACRASLKTSMTDHFNAILLNRYARAMKLICSEYERLFWSNSMSNTNQQPVEESTNNNIDKLQARLFYLITQYSENPCAHIAGHIVKLLTSLCQHPHIELMPAQHYIYSNSVNYWRSRLNVSCVSVSKKVIH